MKIKHHHVVLGGTFDHFHNGHKALIDKALSVSEKVTIGIAGENLYKNKFLAESIEPYEIRYDSVRHYLQQKGALEQVKLIPIIDIFGPSTTDKTADAIIVSKQTYHNTLLINQKRSKAGLPELKIIIADDFLATDGKLLSSERIRAGEMDRKGNIYMDVFYGKERFQTVPYIRMPDNMREQLRKPLGNVFDEVRKVIKFIKFVKPIMVVTVGDIVSQSLEEKKIIPDVKIIDLRSRRKDLFDMSSSGNPSGKPVFRAARNEYLCKSNIINSPGTISKEAVFVLNSAVKNTTISRPGVRPHTLVIDGEEDLLALPAILLVPLNSLVLYGHFELGIIAVTVTEERKAEVKKIIGRFM